MNTDTTQTHTPSTCVIGERIKQIRKANKLTQKEFAASLGIAQGFLCSLERGRKKPSNTLIIAMQHLYNITRQWLYGEESMNSQPPATKPAITNGTQTMIPLVGTSTIPDATTLTGITEEFISMPGLPENCFAIKYSGDFMTPTIRDGDIVVLSQNETPLPGNIVLITGKWEEPFLRRYRSRGGEIYYTADNTAYSPFKPDVSTRTLGVVVSVWRRINL